MRCNEPIGRTGRFVADVRAARGDGYVRSWLSSITCQFEDCVVWTSDSGVAHINRDCADAITAHGVVIRADDASRAHYIAGTDAMLTARREIEAKKAARKIARREKRARKSA